MKEWLDCCMDVCSYGSDIGLKKAFSSIKSYFYQYQNITIIIKGESETCPISEIAIIILSLKFIGSFEAAAFSPTHLFFPPSRFSLLSSGRSLCCLPHFAPTSSRKKWVAKFSLLWAQCEALGFIEHYVRTWNFTRRRTKVNSPSADWLSYLGT